MIPTIIFAALTLLGIGFLAWDTIDYEYSKLRFITGMVLLVGFGTAFIVSLFIWMYFRK